MFTLFKSISGGLSWDEAVFPMHKVLHDVGADTEIHIDMKQCWHDPLIDTTAHRMTLRARRLASWKSMSKISVKTGDSCGSGHSCARYDTISVASLVFIILQSVTCRGAFMRTRSQNHSLIGIFCQSAIETAQQNEDGLSCPTAL
eukprot:3819861-Amphidinium_carterae.1